MKKLGLITACLVLSSPLAFAKENMTTYKTESGSTLEFMVGPKDSILGLFTTAVASKECQQVIGVAKPVIGWVSKNAITFSVNYPECDAVITFVGYMSSDGKSIDTTSIIAHESSAAPGIPGERSLNNVMFNQV